MGDQDDSHELVVDGESFLVTLAPNGGAIFTWTSGPNEGYGFSVPRSFSLFGDPGQAPPPLTRQQQENLIRNFLSGIDPATGYLSE